jgi:hypothetical protein
VGKASKEISDVISAALQPATAPLPVSPSTFFCLFLSDPMMRSIHTPIAQTGYVTDMYLGAPTRGWLVRVCWGGWRCCASVFCLLTRRVSRTHPQRPPKPNHTYQQNLLTKEGVRGCDKMQYGLVLFVAMHEEQRTLSHRAVEQTDAANTSRNSGNERSSGSQTKSKLS